MRAPALLALSAGFILSRPGRTYWTELPGAAGTNGHTLHCFKQHTFVLSLFWESGLSSRAEVKGRQNCPGGPGRRLPPSPARRGPCSPPRLHLLQPSTSSPSVPDLCFTLVSPDSPLLPPSCEDPGTPFRAHPDNQGHLPSQDPSLSHTCKVPVATPGDTVHIRRFWEPGCDLCGEGHRSVHSPGNIAAADGAAYGSPITASSLAEL